VEHNEASKRYSKTLKYTKKHHWHDWLEKAKDQDIWAVHQIISSPASDGRKVCILSLKHKVGDNEVTANNNEGKSDALAKTFFPPKPALNNIEVRTKYPQPCHAHNKITREQI
jgi:hypothetical protein